MLEPDSILKWVIMLEMSRLIEMGYQDGTWQFIEFIEMGFNVGNVKMEPDSLLKWVIMLEMSRRNLTVYWNEL